MCQASFSGVSRVFQEVSKDINGSFKSILCFKKVSRVFQESFNGVSSKM